MEVQVRLNTENYLIFSMGFVIGVVSVGIVTSLSDFDFETNTNVYALPQTCDKITNGLTEEITKEIIDDCQDYLHSFGKRMVRMNDDYSVISYEELNIRIADCYNNGSQWVKYRVLQDGIAVFEEYCYPDYRKSQTAVTAFSHILGKNIFYEVIPEGDFSQQSEFVYDLNYTGLIREYNVTGFVYP